MTSRSQSKSTTRARRSSAPIERAFLIAAIFAAAKSTLSSSLNALASSSVDDFYRPYLRPGADESHYLKVSRLCTLAWAVVLVAISFAAAGSIFRAPLAGTGPRTPLRIYTGGRPYGITVAGNFVFWADNRTGQIMRVVKPL